jgi:hypothetical protein
MAGQLQTRRRGLVALSTVAGLLGVGWLAGMPWLAGHWPRILAVGLFLVVFVAPRWFVPARSAASLAGVTDPAARGRLEDERLKLQHDVRIGLLQAVAGVAVIAAVAATWQQLDTDRRQLRQQLEVAGQEQASERFARALDQRAASSWTCAWAASTAWSGSPPGGAGAATAAGAYQPPGTEGSGEPQGGAPVGRERGSGEPQGVPRCSGRDPGNSRGRAGGRARTGCRCSRSWRPMSARPSHRPPVGPATSADLQVSQPDVHAAAVALARRTVLAGDPPLDLTGSLLGGARLGWARLAGADLRGADLRGTSLQHATLAGTHLEQSLLCGTQFQGADLAGAHLAGARASTATSWPDGFDWRAAGARLVESC